MIDGKKLIVVMPAYNAGPMLEKTYRDIPTGFADEIILCDDCSSDNTVEIAEKLGLTIIKHEVNKGYGANQKTCYDAALAKGADIILMMHPDYQYDPRVIPLAAGFLTKDICDVVIGSRIRGRRETLRGGMPLYKYLSNRALSLLENIVMGLNLGDCHSGYRVYKREVLEKINYHANADDFLFDAQLLMQTAHHRFRIGDVPIPIRYFPEATSMNVKQCIKYGYETLWVICMFLLKGLFPFKIFSEKPATLRKEQRQSVHV